jgi:hypothetical protein
LGAPANDEKVTRKEGVSVATRKIMLTVVFLTMLCSVPVSAWALAWCSGTVRELYMYGSHANVWASWKGDFIHICDLNANAYSNDVCKMRVSFVLSALLSGKETLFFYNAYNSCSEVPAYGGLPDYVMIR